MVNEELRLGDGQESHDGQVNVRLGNHRGRLSDLMGYPTPEQYPISFFEVPEGSVPTLEQVMVINFFNQEYRNVLASAITSESTMTQFAQRIPLPDGAKALERFQDRIPNTKASFDQADQFTGEAQELLSALKQSLARLSSDETPKISPDQRNHILQASRTVLEQVLEEQRVLTDKTHRGEAHSPEEAQRYIYVQGNARELRSTIMYYEMMPLSEVNTLIQECLVSVADLETKLKTSRSMSQTRKLNSVREELAELQVIAADYDGYVARYNSDPVIPQETKRYKDISALIQEAMDAYLAPDLVGGDTSVRQRLEAIFKMPEAKAVLGE